MLDDVVEEVQEITAVDPRSKFTYVQQICLQECGNCTHCPENLLESYPCQVKYSEGVRQLLGLEKPKTNPGAELHKQEQAAEKARRKLEREAKKRQHRVTRPDQTLAPSPTRFGSAIALVRHERGLTRSEFAALTHYTVDEITNLETGRMKATVDDALNFSKRLFLDPMSLIQLLVA